MHATVRLENGLLDLIAPDAGLKDERRPLKDRDIEYFSDWAATYKQTIKKDRAEDEILSLGTDIFNWLDGSESWLKRLRRNAEGEAAIVLEFQVINIDDPGARQFLQVPWELLAHNSRHLAADDLLLFCPLRRLGRIAKPDRPSDECLGLVFMAASPRGQKILDFEEEESAILGATTALGIDIVVEESGNPNLLATQLAETPNMQVLHISCHGRSDPVPRLMLEDEEGGPLEASPRDLIRSLRPNLPRTMFISACQSATFGPFSDAVAMDLIRGGIASVLGWDGSVFDREATAFAHFLYKHLARKGSLEEAVGSARLELLLGKDKKSSVHWHLARLWLGHRGGGQIVGGIRRRRMIATDRGHKEFLDARKQQSPVASREAFVGRRRELQTCLGFLRKGGRAGLLIQGMGRLGKSSLAARISHRLLDLEPVVIFGHYDALSIADAIHKACPSAQDIIDESREALRDHPEKLGDVLRKVLDGPCAQRVSDQQPILLVIDDFERILKEPGAKGSAWVVEPGYMDVVRSVINAFRKSRTMSRLMITSRYKFTLPEGGIDLAEELFAFQLPPMDEASARKQALRHEQSRQPAQVQREEDRDEAEKRRQELFASCIKVARGNPGLQDLLFDLVLQSLDAAATAIGEMEVFVERGEQPEQEKVRSFLENLILDKLIDIAGADGRSLLRALTVFELPVPLQVASLLAKTVGGDVEGLLGLGICDRFEDFVRPPQPAIAVNALVRPKIGSLSGTETEALAKLVLDSLYDQWGGTDAGSSPSLAEFELTRLALIAENPAVLASCASGALSWLDRQYEYRLAADWGKRAINILDSRDIEPTIGLLRRAGEACVWVADTNAAEDFYGRALAGIDRMDIAELEPFEHTALLTAQGRLLVRRGDVDRAVELFKKARGIEISRGNERNATVLSGEIADILSARGDLDEALRIRREEELPVYERLGDVRSKAVTMGQIADILSARGDLDEALRIYIDECLPVAMATKDLDGIAHARFSCAQLRLKRGGLEAGEMQTIYEELAESFAINLKLQRADGIAFVGLILGQILAMGGHSDDAIAVLEQSAAAFEKLQKPEQAKGVRNLQKEIRERIK